jgi:hypothetical protein
MKNDEEMISETVNLYFLGTYHGDVEKLKRAFHSEARITGVINDQVIDWSLADFIARVSTEPTAAKKNEIYDKKILSIDVTHSAAMVKSRVAVGDLIFTDYITLLKINENWIIRNKSFTN